MTQTEKSNSLWRLLRSLASLRLAVVVLGLLAVVLATATFYESLYGTPAAQRNIYGAWWFAGILLVLGVNVAAATIIRWSWRPKYVGFVVTHAALLLILGGCLVTQWRGINGRMSILQGHQEDRVLQDELALVVLGHDDNEPAKAVVPVGQPPRLNTSRYFMVDDQPYQARILQYMPDALVHSQVIDGAEADPAAVLVELELAGRTMSQWLFVDDSSRQWSVRMPGFSLAAASKFLPPETPANMPAKGKVLAQVGDREYSIDVEQSMREAVAIGDTGTTLRVKQYYEHADVGSGKLAENPAKEINPVVVLELITGQKVEQRIVFARYGDVTAMHAGGQVGPVRLAYQHAVAAQSDVNLTIVPRQDKVTLYEASGKDLLQQIEMLVGQTIPLKNLKMSLVLKEFRQHARATTVVEPATQRNEDPQPAVEVELTGPDVQYRGWLAWGEAQRLSTEAESLRVVLQPKEVVLPFAIRLNQFDLEKYPGTDMPKMYRSRVTVLDSRIGEERTVNIEMNRPLEYDGWTFFQSSYRPEGDQWVTVLSASRDPGKIFAYCGAGLLVIGTIILAIQRLVVMGKASSGNRVTVPARTVAGVQGER